MRKRERLPDIRQLPRLGPKELQAIHREIFGAEHPIANCQHLRRKIAWHIQAAKEGGLPEVARSFAISIARGTELRTRASENAARRRDREFPRASTALNPVRQREHRQRGGSCTVSYYVDELTTDLWAIFDGDVAASTDPLTVDCTVHQNTARTFHVGDVVIINDEAADPDHSGRRSYECAQIVGPGDVGDVVPTGEFRFQRAYPGVPDGQATFGTLRCAHQAGVKFYKLDLKTFSYSVKKGFFRTPGLPARIEAKLPSGCIVAAVVSVANHFGYGPFTVIPLSHHNEPLMPGERTCSGGAYTFQMSGALAAQDDVPIPMRVHDPASIRCIFAYLQTGTSDGSCGLRVKYSARGGDTWLTLEKTGIAQNVGTPFKTSYDHLLAGGLGPPESRRLPYRDYGLINTLDIVASPDAQVIPTASYDGTTTGLVEFDFVFFDFGGPNEEYVYIQSLDPPNQTFTAVVKKDHPTGTKLSPAVWPTPVCCVKATTSPSTSGQWPPPIPDPI